MKEVVVHLILTGVLGIHSDGTGNWKIVLPELRSVSSSHHHVPHVLVEKAALVSTNLTGKDVDFEAIDDRTLHLVWAELPSSPTRVSLTGSSAPVAKAIPKQVVSMKKICPPNDKGCATLADPTAMQRSATISVQSARRMDATFIDGTSGWLFESKNGHRHHEKEIAEEVCLRFTVMADERNPRLKLDFEGAQQSLAEMVIQPVDGRFELRIANLPEEDIIPAPVVKTTMAANLPRMKHFTHHYRMSESVASDDTAQPFEIPNTGTGNVTQTHHHRLTLIPAGANPRVPSGSDCPPTGWPYP